MTRALCAELEPAQADRVFFSTTKSAQTKAEALCRRCPVARACLEVALEGEGQDPAGYRFGVYAGTTGLERARAVGASTYLPAGRVPR